MKRLLPLLAWAFVPIVAANALAQAGDGYVGIYSNSAGTLPCTTVPQGTGKTLYVIAKTAGASASGITGGEFRIEVTNPSGWEFSYTAPSGSVALGDPLDLNPGDPNDGSGLTIAFSSCHQPVAGNVSLGTVHVYNDSGTATNLLVKRRSTPSNPGFACPLFVECDDPYYTNVCMTASPPDSCSLGVQKAIAVSSDDPVIFTSALNAGQSGPPPEVGHYPSRIVVWFNPGVVALPQGRTAARIEDTSFGSPDVRTALQAVGARDIEMLTPTATLENLVVTDAAGTRALDRSQLDMYRVTLADTNVSAAVSALGADPDVLEASPDWMRHTQLVPNDPLFSKEWWLRNTGQYNGVVGADLNVAAAWDRTGGLLSLPVDVVVIDTGVDAGHPELAGRVIDGPNYVTSGPPNDDDVLSSHGTSVAGIIGAQGNNTIGVAGVDWNARIVRIKACDEDGNCPVSNTSAAVDWARVHGYRIVNLSLGGSGASQAEQVVFKNAFLAGMAVFAAMGNDNGRTTDYPAAYSPFTIAVGAMMHTKVRWDDLAMPPPFVPNPNARCYPCGSNTGPHIRFVAPGGRYIETTRSRATGSYWALDPNLGEYGFGGTSAATPAAAGVAALVQSLEPNLTGEDLAQVLGSPARTIDLPPDGWDPGTGWGLIDADADVAFVSGQNKLEQGTITSVADVSTVNGGNRTIFGWPGITDGTYLTYRHTIQGTATFSQPFIATPAVWPRQASSNGADTENPIVYSAWSPHVRVLSVNSTQVMFEAYVYDFREQVHGSHVAWWPTTPSGVYFAYTAIGPISVTDAEGTAAARPLGLAVAPIPARSSAHLEFSLAKPGETKLAIYDVAGRLVRSLVAQRLDAGAHGYGWDLRSQGGQPVGSGMYFARLNTAAGTRVTRLVVLR